MNRVKTAQGNRVHFWCPGCDQVHGIHTNANGWTWNGDRANPTFSPSVLMQGGQWAEGDAFYKPNHSKVPPGGEIVCHSFVTDGRIQFLNDSTHSLSGQTVDLPPWPYE